MAIATATTIIVVINPSSIPHQSYVHSLLLQKRVPPKPKDPFQSRCLEHLFANYLCWSKAESVPLSNAVMSFCPTMLAHTIHGLKKPIENCLAEVGFNQLHPCDTPEKWISSDTLHLFSMFEWWMSGCSKLDLKPQIPAIFFGSVSTSSWSPILLCRLEASGCSIPKNDFSKKNKKVILSKRCFHHSANGSKKWRPRNCWRREEINTSWRLLVDIRLQMWCMLSIVTVASISARKPRMPDTWEYLLFQKVSSHLLANPHFQTMHNPCGKYPPKIVIHGILWSKKRLIYIQSMQKTWIKKNMDGLSIAITWRSWTVEQWHPNHPTHPCHSRFNCFYCFSASFLCKKS